MNKSIDFRPGSIDDSYSVFYLFERTLADLNRRLGLSTPTSAADPQRLACMWEERRSLYEHLARTAEHFWIAERQGQAIGFARSILRDGVQQLTELFVLPGEQSCGVGRELIRRTLPEDGAVLRSIISTSDMRAQIIYLKEGVYPRFPIYYFGRKPEEVVVGTDLTFEPITTSPDNLSIIGELDVAIIGHRRDVDHEWLSSDRQGNLYFRDGKVVGYGYIWELKFIIIDCREMPGDL